MDNAPLQELIAAAAAGWQHSEAGRVEDAKVAYRRVDQLLPEGDINPELSVLRHNPGVAVGTVTPIPPTEDRVATFILPETAEPSFDTLRMKGAVVSENEIERNLRVLIESYDHRLHRRNITRDLPHVLFLSTGRCGTVSLYRLLHDRGVEAYHTYWWLLAASTRWEMMCRIMDGAFDDRRVADLWAASRAAEWLGAMASNRPMVGFNHLDTIFSPVFAAIHPQSKFVHLHRDPERVFNSFFGKAQWGGLQLCPLFYDFAPEFRFCIAGYDLPEQIAWYVHFTAVFAEAMGRVVGSERFLSVSSDRLFNRDRDEIERLIAFTGATVSVDEACDHFATPINEKAHKATLTTDEMTGPRLAFRSALARLRATGRL